MSGFSLSLSFFFFFQFSTASIKFLPQSQELKMEKKNPTKRKEKGCSRWKSGKILIGKRGRGKKGRKHETKRRLCRVLRRALNGKSFLQGWDRGCSQPRGDRGRAPLPPSSSRPVSALSILACAREGGTTTARRPRRTIGCREAGAGPRPPYGATTIPPPSTLLQTHRVLGISSSMAAAVAAAPQGPALRYLPNR